MCGMVASFCSWSVVAVDESDALVLLLLLFLPLAVRWRTEEDRQKMLARTLALFPYVFFVCMCFGKVTQQRQETDRRDGERAF